MDWVIKKISRENSIELENIEAIIEHITIEHILSVIEYKKNMAKSTKSTKSTK